MSRTRSSLLEQIRDLNDTLSWSEFDQIYRPLLFRYARSRGLGPEEAEEVVQECMVSIAQRIQRFERKPGFRRWLRGMVTNKVNARFHKRGRERQGRTGDFARPQEREKTPSETWEREWNRAHLLHCLARIRSEVADHTYRAFELYVIAELPVRQIARQLAMTPNQIYVAKSRILARLETLWSEMMERTP